MCVYCVCLMKNKKSKGSVAHSSEKSRPFKSSLASVALCITLQSAGQIVFRHLCVEEVYHVTPDQDIYREKQRGEPCLNEPFLLMLHQGRL